MDQARRIMGTTPYVRSFMARSNMEVMSRISVIVSVFAAALFASTFTSVFVWAERAASIVSCYRIFFAALLSFNLMFSLLSRRYLSEAEPVTAWAERHMFFYVTGVSAMSLWITIVDFAELGRYFFLLVALFMVFGLFFIPPLHTLLTLAIVWGTMLGGLGLEGLLSPIQIITLSAYLIVVFAVSASNYLARVEAGRVNEGIRNASRHDDLTGVLNKRAFGEDAPALAGNHLFLLLADIDEFKYVNDLFGHRAGDKLIVRLGETLVESFQAGSVYRFGGDEFIVVFVSESEDELRDRISAVREAFCGVEVGRRHVSATISVGCVHGVPETADDVRDFLRIADMLLFRAREEGAGRVSVVAWSSGLQREAITHSVLASTPNESTDAVCGLMDSDLFVRRASEVAPLFLERGDSVSFVYLNVCDLKGYNAHYGYEAGDDLLRQVASVLTDVFPGRLLSHFGEGHFCLMTDEEGLAEAIVRASDLVAAEGGDGTCRMHAGVFRYVDGTLSVRVACDCARIACESLSGYYDVTFAYFTPELGAAMERRSAVLARFGAALEAGHIQPYYQPIIRSASDLVSEFEVLARWVDPTDGVLSPATFIGALEDAHLIHLLDLEIVRGVCRNYKIAQEQGLPISPVSVNFSRLDFAATDVVEDVTRILDEHGVDHSLVRVEITESALGENDESIRDAISRFHERGFQVWMDDFGSGYSALNVLRDYDFDLVKFDMVFLRGMNAAEATDPSLIMLTNLVSMVKELGMQTLVEGVETVEQMQFLRGIGVEKLQGYVFDRPVPFQGLTEGLKNWTYMIEEADKRSYFDLIGAVNLMQPIEPGSAFDPKGIAEGVPCAVLEYDGAEVRFLEHNEAFQMRLTAANIVSTVDSEVRINAALARPASRTHAVLERLAHCDDWVRVALGAGVADMSGYARTIARVEGTSTVALMFFAL